MIDILFWLGAWSFRLASEKKYLVEFIVKLLALALTNLVLDLAKLVTKLDKPSLGPPSHQPDQT